MNYRTIYCPWKESEWNAADELWQELPEGSLVRITTRDGYVWSPTTLRGHPVAGQRPAYGQHEWRGAVLRVPVTPRKASSADRLCDVMVIAGAIGIGLLFVALGCFWRVL